MFCFFVHLPKLTSLCILLWEESILVAFTTLLEGGRLRRKEVMMGATGHIHTSFTKARRERITAAWRDGCGSLPQLGALEGTRWKSCPEAKSHLSACSHFHQNLHKSLSPSWSCLVPLSPVPFCPHSCPLRETERENSPANNSFLFRYPTTAPWPFHRGTDPGSIAYRESWEQSWASCREWIWEHQGSCS